ncbi:hypothetical protein QJS10_CPB19g01111 [Acorus calamus]|uniref:Phosphoribulokinase/uridine kinase domain-containing protein n=1 Tax=Acorus calamus TaxID=4465 RepID=A0AAV9CH08_ACOCL|nr:hypothetical protein QJS10_CPB19g01111 [Acorus calamus]
MAISLSQKGLYWCCSSTGLSNPKRKRHVNIRCRPLFISPSRLTIQTLQCQTGSRLSKQKVISCHSREAPVLEARSIEEVYEALTDRLLTIAVSMKDSKSKYIVGVAGPPGAGKSTVASEVVRRLNMRWSKRELMTNYTGKPAEIATIVPMDGFHLYRSQLDAMEDPKEAHARRGAPWTFDPALLLKCLNTLQSQGYVYAPSFDHGVGDPVEDDIFVNRRHKLVIVEGNYLLLDEGVWREVSSVFNEKWFIDIEIDKAMQRVLKRHISTGKTPDIASWRVEYNDRPNAELIMTSKKNADLVIRSVDL